MSVNDEVTKIDDTLKTIAVNAMNSLTTELVRLEQSGIAEKALMDDCVWPILHEASRRFDAVRLGDDEVELGNFALVVRG